MAIVQTIKFNAPYEYFVGFIQDLIEQSGVKASVKQSASEIELVLAEDDKEALERFSQLAQKYLPHSIYLGEVNTQHQDIKVQQSSEQSKDYAIAPCPQCLELLTNPASDRYLDDTLVCTHYANDGVMQNDPTTFSPHYSGGNTLLITDAQKIDELFYMTTSEKKALFSIEKPTLKVTIASSQLVEQTGKNYIRIKSAPTVKSTIAALNAKESGIDYLFFDDSYGVEVRVIKDDVVLIENATIESLQNLSDDAVMNRFLNIKNEAGFSNAIGAHYSSDMNFEFILSAKEEKKVIKFASFCFDEVTQKMRNDKTRAMLMQNFESKYPETIENFLNSNDDMFEAVAALLELEGGYEAVSEKALEYRGNGGVKLDTKFIQGGLDHMNFLASIMSFKLAGTSTAHLAYSVFESLADMGISMMGQLEKKFGANEFVMLGDMFENSVFYSRVKSKFAMSNPYFAKAIGLS